uniref:Uncharacterized protein n=1 Tax=Oryzias latipes TaxID=8090 RepID=A0A3B3HSL3_ORYLA
TGISPRTAVLQSMSSPIRYNLPRDGEKSLVVCLYETVFSFKQFSSASYSLQVTRLSLKQNYRGDAKHVAQITGESCSASTH